MTDRRITLSRRQLLGGIATLGSASAAAGAGTFALFSDSERAEGSVTAGSLDLEIVARNGNPVDGDSGTVTFLDGANALPGDSGTATVTLKNTGTLDGFLDLSTVRLIDDGNGLTDPESEVDNSDGEGEGELAEALDVSVALTSGATTQYLCPVFDGGTASLAATFQEGETYDLDYALASGQEVTFELSWSLPSDTGNETQGDSAGIELDFHLEQNKDDTGTAVCPEPSDGSNGGDDGESSDLDSRLAECGISTDDLATETVNALQAAFDADNVRTLESGLPNNPQVGDGEAVFIKDEVPNNINGGKNDGVVVVCGSEIDTDGDDVGNNVKPDHVVLVDTSVRGNVDAEKSVSIIGEVTIGGNLSVKSGALNVASGATLTVGKKAEAGSATVADSASVTVKGKDKAGIETEED